MSVRNSIPFGRLLAEGLLIVLSILLAFALDAGWGNLQELSEEAEILRRLETEAAANLDQLVEKQNAHDDAREAAAALLGLTGLRTPPAVHADSVGRLIFRMTFTWSYDPGNGVLSSLVNSDKLRLIRSDSLRTALASWPALVADIQEDEQAAWRVLDERVTPFLDRHLAWRMLHDLSADSSAPYAHGPGTFEGDLIALLRNREFENIVVGRLATQENILFYYGPLRERLERMLRLIRSELERDG
jgi:hypothetical protein